MALKSVSIGHAETAVDFGAHRLARRGVNMSRPTPEEFELAEILKRHIPSAEMVKFGKNGSDATAAAIRLARAYTGRDLVIRPREDPFLGVHDWFIGSTIMNRGVPQDVARLTLTFPRGVLEALESLFRQNAGNVAAVILEPTFSDDTGAPHYMNLREIVSRNGAILIFDETITGFRYGLAGAQGRLDVVPDLSTFGKAIANGYPLSALVGREEIMRLGGIDHDENRVFLMSSTYGAERSAIGAGIASLKFMEKHDVAGALRKTGTALIAKLTSSARDNGLSQKFKVAGDPANPFFSFPDENGGQDLVLKTLFMEHFLSKGILLSSNWFTPAYRHKGRALKQTLKAIDEVFVEVGNIVKRDHLPLASFLRGQPINQVFRQKN
jgi:glutamate-1-semialdehyde 2,1-aminomutase